jgi:hypothetical protein
MDINQEEILYEFLENITEPFTLEEVTSFMRMPGKKHDKRLAVEITTHFDSRKIAFKLDSRHWVSRRGCFEPVRFVISPSRLELQNGILIPGHRCVPFANPVTLPHNYKFLWKGRNISVTTTEAPPEDLYPYFAVYGEEFAPQYIARDNPENESAFLSDPYEDPPEVSIHTLDMRGIYRECSFVPGDRFVARTLDWKESCFELEKISKDEWSQTDLYNWFEAAEGGFEDSFALLGPGVSTEEQIAYAYWYGGERMREIPAYSLEEYLFEKTERVEAVPYGIETRFWFADKEIPDSKKLHNYSVPPDRTFVEELLFKKNIPISEFVILSYVKDAFFRNEKLIDKVVDRVVPPVVRLEETEWDIIAEFVSESMDEFFKSYSLFLDQRAGPVRQRVAELHTAVIELSTRLQKGEIDPSWLPMHTFIILSQIQSHSSSLLEDLAFDEAPPESEITAMDNSLDSMIETYSDVKELIENAMDNYRRSNLTVIHSGSTSGQLCRIIQISVSGTEVWRRAVISHDCALEELHKLIQICMDWKSNYRYRFFCENQSGEKQYLHEKMRISDVQFQGKKEFVYEYGAKWTVKIIIMSAFQPVKDEAARFVAGDGAAPPETVGGPLRFRKILSALETGNNMEKQAALHELGHEFVPGLFDLDKCNRNLRAMYSLKN